VLILVEPPIEVKAVIDHAPAKADGRDSLLLKERDANAQVRRCLFLGEAANCRQRERRFIHVSFNMLRMPSLASWSNPGLSKSSCSTYDVILLDLLMPGIGGFEVLKRIRDNSANKSTPVIIVSVRGTSALVQGESVSVERAAALGANAVIFKPFAHSRLILALKEQLRAKA
jgi:CheY-like chemotaxis protein